MDASTGLAGLITTGSIVKVSIPKLFPSKEIDFEIHPRVWGQLNDNRMGALKGTLGYNDLQKLLSNPAATRILDSRTGHINIIQDINGKLLRITVPRDGFKVISVGPIRSN